LAENREKFVRSVEEYGKKYEPHLAKFQEWIPIVGKDRKLTCIADSNFSRSEFLSMLGLSFAVEECRALWAMLERERPQQAV
jgi:hypothetical protein